MLLLSSASAQYRFDHWTADNGLPQNSVYSIAQTRDGYLWFTTFDGLVRFDGVRFTVFNKANSKGLTSNRVVSIFADNDTLWLCTVDGGLVRFCNGVFQTFTTADGLPSNRVSSVQKDLDGDLLIFTPNGLLRLLAATHSGLPASKNSEKQAGAQTRSRNGHIIVDRQEPDKDYKVYVSPSHTRWEMDAAGLRTYYNGHMKGYALPFDSHRISPDRTFNYFVYVQMLEDRDGALWFSASGNLYRMKDGATTTYTADDGLPQSLIRDILQDRQGDIWLATEKDGICRLSENRFTSYNTTRGLSSNRVMDLFEDREGTLWVGTYERGINRLTRQVVTPLSTAKGLLDKNVYPLLEDRDGSVWIGSYSALSHYKDGIIKNHTRRDGLLYEIVQALHQDRSGRLWIGSLGGIEYYERGKFIDFTERLGISIGDFDFWAIHQDRDRALWFGTSKGLIQYQNGAATRYTTENGLPSNDVKVIHESHDGSLWIGTDGGVARLSGEREGGGKAIVAFTERGGLASNHVRAIHEDMDGTFWFGTYDGGLSRFRDGKFTNYTTKNGLYSDGVFQILEDARGNFWMSSNQGIYRVSKNELNEFAEGKRRTITSIAYGKSDGMLNGECNGGRSPAGIKARDGRLWFPTQDGVAIIHPETIPINPQPPPVVVEDVTIENQSVAYEALHSAIGNLQSAIQIEPNQQNFEIHYTALSFINAANLRFKYKLEGLDRDWVEAGTRRTAYFSHVPPGDYVFKIIAANSDGVWNEEGTSLNISVLPPFYRTWWFLTSATLVLFGAIFSAFRVRLNRLENARKAQEEFSRQLLASQEQERQRIAAELHDGLGQSIVVLKNRALLALQNDTSDTAKEKQLEEISTLASTTLKEIRRIAHNLRPANLERFGLRESLNSLLDEVSSSSGLQIASQVDDLSSLLDREAEMHLFRVVQEALANITKHAHATTADVSVTVGENIRCVIRDNGKGFDVATHSQGHGRRNIDYRVKMLGGTATCESALGIGTTLTIEIPHSSKEKKS